MMFTVVWAESFYCIIEQIFLFQRPILSTFSEALFPETQTYIPYLKSWIWMQLNFASTEVSIGYLSHRFMLYGAPEWIDVGGTAIC